MVCAVFAVSGCGTSSNPTESSTSADASAVAKSKETPAVPAELTPATAVDVAAAAAEVAAQPFTPPFPDRVDPFAPPKRANGTVRKDEEAGSTVELKGFVKVDVPRVVLSINGVIAPISEGGEKYGVQVISIDPPSAVLQRGRTRWTAKLE